MGSEKKTRVLVADDHMKMARVLADQLGDSGYDVDVAGCGTQALDLIRRRMPDLVITDLRMEDVDGLEVLDGVRRIDPETPVIIMTAFGAIESAIEAMKHGAFHYLTKPFQLDELLLQVQRALDQRALRDENRALRRLANGKTGLGLLVGSSAPMRELYGLIERVASTGATVLIRGESGTGKELVAKALHDLGPRRNRPFIPVSCTSLPENLLESELFGHVQGAFSGAAHARRGLVTEADRGTLFLDEIGDMPIELQAKVLRVLQDGEVRAVGADVARKVDIQVIAATHQPLEELVRVGRFRADLFYRLNVVPVTVPPLRERAEDVPLLVEHFIARACNDHPGARVRTFSPGLVSALVAHHWPGNVRELENVVRRLMIVVDRDVADVGDVERHAPAVLGAADLTALADLAAGPFRPLRQIEDDYISMVVRHCEGNRKRAAEILGIDESTIYRRERRVRP